MSVLYTIIKFLLEVFFGKKLPVPDPPTPPNQPPSPPVPPPNQPPSPEPSSEMVMALLNYHNQERAKAGSGPLALNFTLNMAAQAHTEWMADHQNMSHNEGLTGPGHRIEAMGYKASSWGENIAMGYPSPKAVMVGWMNSSGHKANILRAAFTEVGFGIAKDSRGRYYWTSDFGRPRQGVEVSEPETFPSGPLTDPDLNG